MSINVIAMLVSLAMLLTGAGSQGQPAQATRVATLHNVVVSYNGDSLRLSPEAHLGVSTDGQGALFDFGVDLDGGTLMPVQVGVKEDGVTALFAESGEAVTVTAQALENAVAGVNGQLAALEDENPELMEFLLGEYLPAYAAVVEMMSDPDAQAELKARGRAIFDAQVDRGEGVADTVEVEGEEYAVTRYSYSLDGPELGALVDAVYTGLPELEDYYAATFKLYSMLPDESGLADIDSFSALMERSGMAMTMDVEERMTDDGEVDVMDAVMTVDMSALAQPEAVEEAAEAIEEAAEDAAEAIEGDDEDDGDTGIEPEGDDEDDEYDEYDEDYDDEDDDEVEEAPAPIVMNLHTTQVGDFTNSEVTWEYELEDGQGMSMSVTSAQESAATDLELDFTLLDDGAKTARTKASAFVARDDAGGSSYNLTLRSVVQDAARLEFALYGAKAPDGTSENSFSMNLRTAEGGGDDDRFPMGFDQRAVNLGLSFDLDVTDGDIADATADCEPAWIIDDLSGEALEDQAASPAVSALLMKVAGSLGMDAAKLAGDSGVSRLLGLVQGKGLPIDVDDIDDEEDYELPYALGEEEDDYEFLLEDDDLGLEMDDDAVEDDGVLGFPEPRLGWLPEGWTVADTQVDTAYDGVEMSIVDGSGAEAAYALFFADPDADAVNYIVQEDGKLVEGREVNVADFGEGSLSVTVREGGVYGNLVFISEAIDSDTLGRIVAGIEF